MLHLRLPRQSPKQLPRFTLRNTRFPPGTKQELKIDTALTIQRCPDHPGPAALLAQGTRWHGRGLPYVQVSQPGSFAQPELVDFGPVPGFPDIRQPTRSGSSNRAVGWLEVTDK